MSLLLLYHSESPATHTHTHTHSNPDGWLHRSAWVSFMIPGSPTSLTRHQPAAQANTTLTLSPSLSHTQSRSLPAAATHPETTERPHQVLDFRRWPLIDIYTPSYSLYSEKDPSRTNTNHRNLCTRRDLRLYWRYSHWGKLLSTFLKPPDAGVTLNPVVPQCPRCCHTTRGKWAATGRTARSVRCPLAADCRTQAPFSLRRRRKDPQSLDRSAEPNEVNDGYIYFLKQKKKPVTITWPELFKLSPNLRIV